MFIAANTRRLATASSVHVFELVVYLKWYLSKYVLPSVCKPSFLRSGHIYVG